MSKRREKAEEVLDRHADAESIDEVPLEDVVEYFRALRERATLDLHDVSIYYGPTDPIQVSNVRLRLDRISAWWPAKAQGVNVNYVWHEATTDS